MDVDAPSDEDLVRRIRAGDAGAGRVLFKRYSALLRVRGRRYVVGGMKRKLGESDLVQDAYLAAFQGLERFEDRGPGSFRRWLQSIFDHKAKDGVKRYLRSGGRSVRREDSVVSSVGGVGPIAAAPTQSSLAVRNEERAALRDAIGATTGDDRLVLELVHERGMGFEEAGRMMGRSAEATRKLYGRVVLRLARRVRRSREGKR